jgi:hypothetical protein
VNCEQKRSLPPLKQDHIPVFFALNVIGHVTTEDLVMQERMHLIGVWEHWQGAMQDPPVKGVFEQSRVEKEKREPSTGTENSDQIQHMRCLALRRASTPKGGRLACGTCAESRCG